MISTRPLRDLPIATRLQEKGGIPVTVAVEGKRPHPYVGKTIFIDNQVDKQTSTFLVRAEVPNPDGSILPGQYIKATITLNLYDAIVVPEQAVLEGQEGPRVYVVDAANKVQVAKVTPVDDYQGLRVLESGLEAGQRVIVEGIQLVKQGQVVEPVEVPLDQFRNTAPPALDDDLRFDSQVSRLPATISTGEKTEPESNQAQPDSKKAEPESKKLAPDSKAAPEQNESAAPHREESEVRRQMVNFFIGRPIFATVLALLMLLIGGICIFILPIAQYPADHAAAGSGHDDLHRRRRLDRRRNGHDADRAADQRREGDDLFQLRQHDERHLDDRRDV